jgi:tetratricopeptide (TPR) repeat protein
MFADKDNSKDSTREISCDPDGTAGKKDGAETPRPDEGSFAQMLVVLADRLRSAQPTESSGSWADRVGAVLRGLRTAVANVAIVVVIAFLALLAYAEMRTDTVIMEPFEVAPALEAQGYSGRVIVNRLLDQMTYISSTTQSIVERREVMPDWLDTNVDIEIPGSRVSLISMMGYIRKWLGRKPTRIVGEVTVHNDQIQVTARIIGMPARTVVGELEDLDGILQQVAEHLYKHTQPYILASYWWKVGEYEQSLDLLAYILRSAPTDDDCWAYNLWGLIARDQGRHNDAIEKFKKAIELDPGMWIAHSNWGGALYLDGDYKGAEAKFRKVAELAPRDTDVYFDWGIALTGQGRYEDAIEKHKKAIELDPTRGCGYLGWGHALASQGYYEDAVEKYRKALELENKEPERVYYALVGALMNLDDYEGAASVFHEALALGLTGLLGEHARSLIESPPDSAR